MKENLNDCLSCSHSFSTDDNKLVCVFNQNDHEEVEESFICENFN